MTMMCPFIAPMMCSYAAARAANMSRQIASGLLAGSVMAILIAAVFYCPLGAANEPEQDQEEQAQRDQGLKNMKRSAAQYSLSSAESPKQAFKFHETPYLRSSNPIGGSKDGVLFLW